MLFCAWILSAHKKKMNLRIIVTGILLQFFIGVCVLRIPIIASVFAWMGEMVTTTLGFVDKGAEMVFGEGFREHFFAFRVLPTIIFFSALISLLYHFGILQIVIKAISWIMQKTIGTSGAETLCCAGNVFTGMSEAPMLIKPYIGKMTDSEIMTIMVAGFATVAGGVMALYISYGIDATSLLSASLMSAPAALVIAKILQPETEAPMTLGTVKMDVPKTGTNALEAVTNGGIEGAKIAAIIGVMVLVFIALIALIDSFLVWFGMNVVEVCIQFVNQGIVFCGGTPFEHHGVSSEDWSLENIFGYVFYPFAFVMGIEQKDCFSAGKLLGLKMCSNELLAYMQLSEWKSSESGVELSDRTITILTYALCGFANFGSIGIQIGGIGTMAPEKQATLARLAFRAMLGGTLAAFMTGCIAGALM